MRLRYIKLSGFKSFADVVRVEVSGNLTGVVGPNGCGKSNIIDAVRWVLGERSLSKLRGSEMTDVIFNGSQSRRPVGRTGVELFFDNEPQDFGGVWSTYPELSVKRELIRATGQSSYLINGKTVRLKDIQKIFMGTGLGANSPYAIIGQGDITEIIESRPEDMRARMEEAAGVSFYKQRRQETEHSLEASHRNLERISDILSELEASIEVLKAQSETAEKYTQLTGERRKTKHLGWFLQFKKAKEELGALEESLEKLDGEIQEIELSLASFESELTVLRSKTGEASKEKFEVQNKLRAAEARISGLQREIDVIRSRRKFLTEDTEDRKAQEEKCLSDIEICEGEKDLLEQEYEEGLKKQEELRGKKEELIRKSKEEEELYLSSKRSVDEAYKDMRLFEKKAQELGFSIRSLRAGVQEARSRLNRLEKDLEALPMPKRTEIAEAATQIELLEAEIQKSSVELKAKESAEEGKRRLQRETEEKFRNESARLQSFQSTLASLRNQLSLIEKAENVEPWMKKNAFRDCGRFSSGLKVKEGWETALETFLGEKLKSHFYDGSELSEILETSANKEIVLLSTERGGASASAAGFVPFISLISYEGEIPSALNIWLSNLFAAESKDEALANLDRLAPEQSFILKDGTVINRFFVKKVGKGEQGLGLLVLRREAEHLEQKAEEQKGVVAKAREEMENAEAEARRNRSEISSLQQALREKERKRNDLRVRLSSLKEKNSAYEQQKKRIDRELAEQKEKEASLARKLQETLNEEERNAVDLRSARERTDSLRGISQSMLKNNEAARQKVLEIRFEEDKARIALNHIKEKTDQAESKKAALKDVLDRLSKNLERNRKELEILDDSRLKISLVAEEQVKNTLLAEAEAASEKLQEAEEAEKEFEGKRREKEELLAPLRKKLSAAQQKLGSTQANKERFGDLLDGEGADYSYLWEESAKPGYSVPSLKAKLTILEEEIARLGPVNLAAVSELAEKNSRYEDLVRQCEDIKKAIKTLNDAIKRIDTETEERLNKTFSAVNENFNDMFVKLFGGGHAGLEKSDENILQAGFIVKAQPPGKRNSTLGALSGGEKALTAIAFVLAIFKLNPAPFCLLDEVDAPLDEANQDRFARLIKDMSATTQFLVITHKRVTMEHLEKIIGVTMKEPGVSQVVGVDMAKAVSYSETKN